MEEEKMYFRLYWWDGDENTYTGVYRTKLGIDQVQKIVDKVKDDEEFYQVDDFEDALRKEDPKFETITIEEFEF